MNVEDMEKGYRNYVTMFPYIINAEDSSLNINRTYCA